MDALGTVLHATRRLRFKGRSRLENRWIVQSRTSQPRLATIPGGAVISCDLADAYESSVWVGHEEASELRALRRVLRPGDVFADVGAHIGLWSLAAAAAVRPGGQVIAFEPDPDNLTRLRRNLGRNPGLPVEVVEAATGDGLGTVTFSQSEHGNQSRIDPEGTIVVEQVTLDSALDRLDGAKIDVEGLELSVLEGADRLLRDSRPWLFLELNAKHTSRRLGDWDCHRHLSERGYEAHPISRFGRLGAPLPDDWRLGEAMHYTNLFYRAG